MTKFKKTRPKPGKQVHQLRIIGGRWRGRKLTVADLPGLRPTGDRIRETLFNWLMSDIADSQCLDLFAGTGALGLECLSRGAESVTLLERHPKAAQQLREHCQLLGTDQAEIVEIDALSWLQHHRLTKYSVDIVFIDPPFADNLWQSTIEKLVVSELLAPQALIYIETPKDLKLATPGNWTLHREKQAGDVSYRLYRLAELANQQ